MCACFIYIDYVCLFYIYMESVKTMVERSSRRKGSSDQIPPSSVGRCWADIHTVGLEDNTVWKADQRQVVCE